MKKGSDAMHEPDDDTPLEARLGDLCLPAPPEALRRRILERTSALVRTRARRRRAVVPLGLAAAFALGFAVAWGARGAGGSAVPATPTHVGAVAPASPGSLLAPPDGGTDGAGGAVGIAAPPVIRGPAGTSGPPAIPGTSGTAGHSGTAGPVAPDPARILERVRDAPREDRPRLLRLAGDSYLARGGDIARALDCYRQLLEVSPSDADASPSPEDPWLLEALKLSRKSHSRR